MRMMRSSGIPTRPSMVLPFRNYEERPDSTTLVLLSVALLGWACVLSAQFRSGVNLVEVYAAVTDEAGNPVTGLGRQDFTVLEDGRPQGLSAFAEGDFPLSVALARENAYTRGGHAGGLRDPRRSRYHYLCNVSGSGV